MRADARANHEAIVRAAWRLIAERGGDVPLSAVAEEAGVGIATLYRRFPLREDLIRAVAIHIREQVVGLIETHQDRVVADPERGWPALVRELAAFRPGMSIPGVLAATRGEQLEGEIQQIRTAVLDALSRPLVAAKNGGVLRADVTATRFMLGLATVTRPLPEGAPAEPDQESWLADIYIAGLRPTGSSEDAD